MVTTLLASAVPERVGFVLLVEAVVVVTTGATGGVVSTVRVMAVEATDIFPAASVDFAVMAWADWDSAVVGVKLHAPAEVAVVVPRTVTPS